VEPSTSFGGNPLAAAAPFSSLSVIVEQKLPEYTASVGVHMKARLHEMQQKFPCIGDVRGMGLTLEVEFIRDSRKTPITAAEAEFLCVEMMPGELFTSNPFSIICLARRRVIPYELADRRLDLFEQTVATLQKR
jgi:4-aminobutyrate aminotransferase